MLAKGGDTLLNGMDAWSDVHIGRDAIYSVQTVLSTKHDPSERRQTSRPSLITRTLTPPGPKSRIEHLEHIGAVNHGETLLLQYINRQAIHPDGNQPRHLHLE